MFCIIESTAASTCRYVFQWTHLQQNATNNWKQVFTMVGKKLNDFGMISPRWAEGNDFGDEIAQELGYDFIALQHQVTHLIPQLLPEQSHVFHQVLSKIESGNGALFFFKCPWKNR